MFALTTRSRRWLLRHGFVVAVPLLASSPSFITAIAATEEKMTALLPVP